MPDPRPEDAAPLTEAGRWLLDHQGLINIGKIDGSMRGDEIDLRAAIVTIEQEAARAPVPEANQPTCVPCEHGDHGACDGGRSCACWNERHAQPVPEADALDDPLMFLGSWTLTITEHSAGGTFEPPEQWVHAVWSSWGVKSIEVNEPTPEDALLAIRAALATRSPQ